MKKRALFYLAFIGLLGIGFFISFFYLSVDNTDKPDPVDYVLYRSSPLDIDSLLKGTPYDSIKSKLTTADYFLSKNIHDYKDLSRDLSILDSLYPGKSLEIRTDIFTVLTDSFKVHLSSALDTFNYAELLNLQNFQIRYYYYAQVAADPNEQLMLNSISLFWGSFIANALSEYSKTNKNLKFGFQYRSLESRSGQYGYGVNRKVTSLEKVIANILGSKWGHLVNSSWNQASVIQKVLFFILFIITIISYFISFKLFFKKLLTKN